MIIFEAFVSLPKSKRSIKMDMQLLLSDEAIAQASLDAGLSGAYAYPGTPSTEILEYIQRAPETQSRKIHSRWSSNEKTAMESALGMSYAGKRALVCLKHVGLNVAADPFINAALTGVNGGLVVVSADDPSMHSSQNEQDSRFYGKFANLPIFEPSSQQESYDMTYHAFDFSEKFKIPVLIRITTRLAHSRSGVKRAPLKDENILSLPSDPKQYILLPALARVRYKELIAKQKLLLQESEKSSYNHLFKGSKSKLGILTCGLAYNYYMEVCNKFKLSNSVLKICQYPVPKQLLKEFLLACDEILVLEEGYPIVEEMLRGYIDETFKIKGRIDETIPFTGELDPDKVAHALGFKIQQTYSVPQAVVNRPPSFCKGCGHADLYKALNEALEKYSKGRVFSDIGCYTLGAMAPYESINSCVDMGASITMAKGASDAGLHPSVCVIGDSTFTHSGMTGLLDVVIEQTPVTIIISDNTATAMTGGQQSSATGKLFEICKGIGVDPLHIRTIDPLLKNHGENVKILKEELTYKGVSIIISQRECIQTLKKNKKISNKAGK